MLPLIERSIDVNFMVFLTLKYCYLYIDIFKNCIICFSLILVHILLVTMNIGISIILLSLDITDSLLKKPSFEENWIINSPSVFPSYIPTLVHLWSLIFKNVSALRRLESIPKKQWILFSCTRDMVNSQFIGKYYLLWSMLVKC